MCTDDDKEWAPEVGRLNGVSIMRAGKTVSCQAVKALGGYS